jgi:hypothetical protein
MMPRKKTTEMKPATTKLGCTNHMGAVRCVCVAVGVAVVVASGSHSGDSMVGWCEEVLRLCPLLRGRYCSAGA